MLQDQVLTTIGQGLTPWSISMRFAIKSVKFLCKQFWLGIVALVTLAFQVAVVGGVAVGFVAFCRNYIQPPATEIVTVSSVSAEAEISSLRDTVAVLEQRIANIQVKADERDVLAAKLDAVTRVVMPAQPTTERTYFPLGAPLTDSNEPQSVREARRQILHDATRSPHARILDRAFP